MPRRTITWCLAASFLVLAFAAPRAQSGNTLKPNYELAADWTAQKVGRLVFDTTVTRGGSKPATASGTRIRRGKGGSSTSSTRSRRARRRSSTTRRWRRR